VTAPGLTVEELGRRQGRGPGYMRGILDQLEVEGHVEHDDEGRYRLTPSGEHEFGRALRVLASLVRIEDLAA
jgi:DNA-binding IclR family transcriptional regulator